MVFHWATTRSTYPQYSPNVRGIDYFVFCKFCWLIRSFTKLLIPHSLKVAEVLGKRFRLNLKSIIETPESDNKALCLSFFFLFRYCRP